MWPFKKKVKREDQVINEETVSSGNIIMDGVNWRQILSEGKTVEMFDGCRAKCDGTFEDL